MLLPCHGAIVLADDLPDQMAAIFPDMNEE
ncbi:MAG: hypothetical protein ACI84R_003656 [Candidatus Azotimanducaceae bacterium]|jgi:hypothetical protein